MLFIYLLAWLAPTTRYHTSIPISIERSLFGSIYVAAMDNEGFFPLSKGKKMAECLIRPLRNRLAIAPEEIFFLTIDKAARKLRIGKVAPALCAAPAEKGSRDYPGRISIKATRQPTTFRHGL